METSPPVLFRSEGQVYLFTGIPFFRPARMVFVVDGAQVPAPSWSALTADADTPNGRL